MEICRLIEAAIEDDAAFDFDLDELDGLLMGEEQERQPALEVRVKRGSGGSMKWGNMKEMMKKNRILLILGVKIKELETRS